MKAFRWILAGAVLGLSSNLFAGQPGRITLSHYEPLQRLSMQTDTAALNETLRGSMPMTLSFDALGQSFDLDLVPHSSFLSQAARDALPGDVQMYRGELAGNPDSWTRIVVYDGAPRGLIWDGMQMYAIEAPGNSIVQTSSPIIYRLADTYIQPGTMSCGSESLSGNGAAVFSRVVGELSTSMAQGAGAVSEINIGAVGDTELVVNRHGGDEAAAAAAIAARLLLVDGIFSQEIGVQINVPLIETFNDPADPFSGTDIPGDLLDELATYRQNTPAQRNLGLTHLYTGRSFPTSTVGIAFSSPAPGSVLCQPSGGAGLSEGNSNHTFDSLIAAHEIGHNFGAPHDGEMGSACEAETQPFIMAPTLNGSMQFSDCSKAIMEANAAVAACVTALPAIDVSVDLNGQLSTVLLGTNPLLVFDVRSNGTVPVPGVVADINLPSNLTIDTVSASAGTCTTNAANVNCVFGDVPGLTVHTVTVGTTASTVGAGMIDATVTTTGDDERPVNNLFSMPLNVDPAVDLVINTPSTVTVTLDQTATIRSTLDNLSILDATGVTLVIGFGSGVRADTANWTAGTCTVAAQQVDCQTANFANQSTSTLTIGVTGLSTGAQSYSVTMSSNEADANPVNNSLNGIVTVSDPARKKSGGAIGLPFLCLLGLIVFVTKRRLHGA